MYTALIISVLACAPPVAESGRVELKAAFVPTTWGFRSNTGRVPPRPANVSEQGLHTFLSLPSVDCSAGEYLYCQLYIQNVSSDRPLAYCAAGGHTECSQMKVSLVAQSPRSSEIARVVIEQPRYRPSGRSAQLCIRRIERGEFLILPLMLNLDVPDGDYTLVPILEVQKGRKDSRPFHDAEDWSGVLRGVPARLCVRSAPNGNEIQDSRAWSKPCIVVPSAVLDGEDAPKASVRCKLTAPKHVQSSRGRSYEAEVAVTKLSEGSTFLYSPIGWHRRLAGLDMELTWTREGKPRHSVVCPIADPNELSALRLRVPTDKLEVGKTIRMPIAFVPPAESGRYELRCHLFPQSYYIGLKGYRPSFSTNKVLVEVADSVPEPVSSGPLR